MASLNSNQLDAFVAIARAQSFSAAARELFVTQSALSQRIKNLEEIMNTTLIIRDPAGLRLTEAGENLLRYCQMKQALENDFIDNFKGSANESVSGSLRLAGFSSVMRSVILPTLSPLLKSYPQLRPEFMVKETSDLPNMLARGQADFIVTDTLIENTNLNFHIIGQENYVAIKGVKAALPGTKATLLYFDHNPQDQTTERFFRHQKVKAPLYRRGFLDDIYGTLDGVALGLGRAVVSEHLARGHKGVQILKEFKVLSVDVYLYYYSQPYYSKLHHHVVKALTQMARELL